MTTNTAKSEAMQAVRLLYGHAAKEATNSSTEALYQARVLLEKFIEGKEDQPPKLKEAFDAGFISRDDTAYVYYYGDAFYNVGEYVMVKTPAEGVQKLKIVGLFPENQAAGLEGGGYKGSCALSEIFALNPTGSFK